MSPTPEQLQEITRLRDKNLSPKQIARQLGLRPAEVTAVIKSKAEEETLARFEKGELAPLERCLMNEKAASYLLDTQKSGWFGKLRKNTPSDDEVSGLAQIFVTRLERNQYLVCSYLIDYWCLGVKDTFGPRKCDRRKYEALVEASYSRFEEDYREITLEEAQSVIFGAIDYAASLGFKPHLDFEQSKVNLGPRLENLMQIEFGKDGKPMYISGPYDNPEKIIATLRETVGEGNFHFMMGIDPGLDW